MRFRIFQVKVLGLGMAPDFFHLAYPKKKNVIVGFREIFFYFLSKTLCKNLDKVDLE